MKLPLVYFFVLAAGLAQTPARLARVAGGLDRPVFVYRPNDRIYVVEQRGRIRTVENGAVQATPYLDIVDRVSCCGEQGLLSMAIRDGWVYVYYTTRQGNLRISKFRGADTGVADPASEVEILNIAHPQFSNHNGGQLVFGPDGYLYIGTGDGGGGGDPFRNGQNLDSLLGKILRIEVRNQERYSIPPTNPFVNRAGARGEIWSYGLRNPWRFSFDRETGDLWIADVGQNRAEEVNHRPAASRGGENYGWNLMEGLQCFGSASCNTNGLILPVHEYERQQGDCSVTGGYLYRGAAIPALRGAYIFGDYCTGRIWTLRQQGSEWVRSLLFSTGYSLASFGEGERGGEIYATDLNTGTVWILAGTSTSITQNSVVNAASYETGLVPGSLASIFTSGVMPVTGLYQAERFPLPESLAGVSVLVGGQPGRILAVAAGGTSGDQINFQVPWEVAAGGPVTLTVSGPGIQTQSVEIASTALQPALFAQGNGFAAARRTNFDVVGDGSAARGETLLFYGTGFGTVDNRPSTGAPAPEDRLAPVTQTVQATVGGRPARVLFAGLAPGWAGLYQVNIEIPADAPTGEPEIVLQQGIRSSRPVKIRVR